MTRHRLTESVTQSSPRSHDFFYREATALQYWDVTWRAERHSVWRREYQARKHQNLVSLYKEIQIYCSTVTNSRWWLLARLGLDLTPKALLLLNAEDRRTHSLFRLHSSSLYRHLLLAMLAEIWPSQAASVPLLVYSSWEQTIEICSTRTPCDKTSVLFSTIGFCLAPTVRSSISSCCTPVWRSIKLGNESSSYGH